MDYIFFYLNGKCLNFVEIFVYYALFELPNSRIFPITVSLIASRAGPKYLRGSYTFLSLSKISRITFVAAIWFSVFTLIFAVPKEIARWISFVGIPVPP